MLNLLIALIIIVSLSLFLIVLIARLIRLNKELSNLKLIHDAEMHNKVQISRELDRLKSLRENDILETNKLIVEERENELNLFFQFENVSEEIVKFLRKGDHEHSKIIESINNIKLLIDNELKNK